MLNVHLNGEIVRCPDIQAIQARLKEVRDVHRICKYNIHEDSCQSWQQSLLNWQAVKRNSNCDHCMLSGTMTCPGHLRSLETGNKKKTFKIDSVVFRKIASGNMEMFKTTDLKTIFVTLTFPPFKKYPNEKQINEAFSRFVHNLHETYGMENYIAVRERGVSHGRYHFHLLCSIPFTDFSILNTAWCHAIQDFCDSSLNAFSSRKGKVILKNSIKAFKYVCKYMAKAKGQSSKSRIVFMSRFKYLKPKRQFCAIEDILTGFDSVHVLQTSDYTTCFRITDSFEFEQFCTKYLYNLFDLPDKKTDFSGLPGSLN